jgi:hypothetical protein
MKNQINAKSGQSSNQVGQRPAGLRPHAAKSNEHRYERRKIREQLRRLDWALTGEDEVYA